MAQDEKPSFLISVRFLLAIVAFIAYATQYTQKINMSVGIVCMVNNTGLELASGHNQSHQSGSSSSNDKCYFKELSSKKKVDGPFLWDKQTQGIILASYFGGYLLTEIPGGYLSLKFGAKIVLGLSILIGSFFTILIPISARLSWIALAACRFIVGAAHGAIWPAFSGFWAQWAPSAERARLIGFANAGSQIGNVIALPLGGFLCAHGFDGGWPSIFYIFGAAGFVWFVLWMVVSSDSPTNHRFIKDKERKYIENETREIVLAHQQGESNAPWLKIFKSRACWAIFLGHSASNWGTYLYLTSLPTYMKEVLKFDIKSSGGLAALPYIVFWLFIILSGIIGDFMLQKLKMTKTKVRKIFNGFGCFVPMAAVMGLTVVGCEVPYAGVALLTVGLAFTGCCYGAGFLVNYNDIAGHYSGIVFGIGNTFATIPGIIAPYLAGLLTPNQAQSEWRIVFIITAVIYAIGGVILLLFTSGKTEPWVTHATAANQDEDENIQMQSQK